MFEVAPDIVALLVLTAFAAGFVDSIAGGGGLIALPVMLMIGASPVEALSTNKLQGTFGAATAALSYGRAGHVDWMTSDNNVQLTLRVLGDIARFFGITPCEAY